MSFHRGAPLFGSVTDTHCCLFTTTRRISDINTIVTMSSVVRKLIPFGNRVLVKRFEPVAKTASGIYLPDADQQKQNEGEVVAVGQGLRNTKGELVPVQAAVGDKVLLPEYGGSLIKLAGEEFHLYRDDDLLGKLE